MGTIRQSELREYAELLTPFVNKISQQEYLITEEEMRIRESLLTEGFSEPIGLVLLAVLNDRFRRSVQVCFSTWP